MKTFFIALGLCISIITNAHSNDILPNSRKANDKAPLVSVFTAYGYARVWFYANGNLKKIKCRAPHDHDCFWIDSSEPNVIHVNLVESASGWQSYAASNYTISTD